MHPRFLSSLLLAAALLAIGGPAAAAERAAPQRERIYGSDLMTHAERERYRARLRHAKTDEAANKVRGDHNRAMQQRARKRGVTLPEAPPRAAAH